MARLEQLDLDLADPPPTSRPLDPVPLEKEASGATR